MRHTPRSLAIEILLAAEDQRLPVDIIQADLLNRHPLTDQRDRNLLNSIVLGVFRQRGYLDWLLTRLSKHPLKKMKPRTLEALRTGLFQLFFLNRIPPSAAINETLKALKIARQPRWIVGFANGVLRTAAGMIGSTPHPAETTRGELPVLARLSHPAWLYQRWKVRYGDKKTNLICRTNNDLPTLTIKINTSKTTREKHLTLLSKAGIPCETCQESPDAILIIETQPITGLPGYKEGLFWVQDQGAQLIPYLFGPLPPSNYLDGCAGLGGKTAAIAIQTTDDSKIIAVEPQSKRANLFQENLQRLNLNKKITLIPKSLEQFAETSKEKFHGVLLDVPCSGLGVIRRHPEIRWFRTHDDLQRYQKIQHDLLHAAAPLVAQGGIIVYATCSTEPEENEEPVAKFLEEHPEFSLSDCRSYLPSAAQHCVDAQGFFYPPPNLYNMDGFFAARLKKIA